MASIAPTQSAATPVDGRHASLDVSKMSEVDRLVTAMRLALPKLPADVRDKVEAMFTPQSLAMMAAGAGVVIAAHAIGIGFIADAAMLALGALTLGPEIVRDIAGFVGGATQAKSEADLQKAGDCFSDAVAAVGVNGVMGFLTHAAGKAVRPLGAKLLPEGGLGSKAPAGTVLRNSELPKPVQTRLAELPKEQLQDAFRSTPRGDEPRPASTTPVTHPMQPETSPMRAERNVLRSNELGWPRPAASLSPLRDPKRGVAFINRFEDQLGMAPKLRADKAALMSQDPLMFYRANIALWYRDLQAANPHALFGKPGPTITIDADPHLGNFGTFRTANGKVAWGLNDFDQAGKGSPEWDLRRLAGSISLTARHNGLSRAEESGLVRAAGEKYFETIDKLAKDPGKHPYLDAEHSQGVVRDQIDKANGTTRLDLVKKFVEHPEGEHPRIIIGERFKPVSAQIREELIAGLNRYGEALGNDTKAAVPLKVLDVAERLGSGGSSQGLSRYYALVAHRTPGHPPVVLELKECLPVPIEDSTGNLARANPADVVAQTKALVGLNNPLTGSTQVGPRKLLIREIEPEKGSVDPGSLKSEKDLKQLSEQAAEALARAHGTQPGAAQKIAAWVGNDAKGGVQRLAELASHTADQTTADYQAFRRSPLSAETTTSMRTATPISSAAKAVQTLRSGAGWKELSPAEQSRLTALISGPTNEFSKLARVRLERFAQDPRFTSQPPAAQGRALSSLLSSENLAPDAVSRIVPPAGPAAPFEIGKPRLERAHSFQGTTMDADVYPIRIDGRTVEVYTPHQAIPSATRNGEVFGDRVNHTVQEAALSLARTPVETRNLVQRLSLHPFQNPEDAFWAKQFKQEDFTSYMTAGANGEVNVYPLPSRTAAMQSADYMRNTLMHETGHVWSSRLWGPTGQEQAWSGWQDAMAADRLSPSTYAMHAATEDAAESTALYNATRGTPLFEEYRSLFPARFQLLDSVFSSP